MRAISRLDLAEMQPHLRYDVRRVSCKRWATVVVEAVPRAEQSSLFTHPFEDHVGYLAPRSDKITVSDLMRWWSRAVAMATRSTCSSRC